MRPDGTVVVVGASAAGVTVAEELRSLGHVGPLVLVEAENEAPYAKPPLSKAVLAGDEHPDAARLPATDHLGLEYLSGAAVTGLDVDNRRVHLAGESLDFDGLVIATGARARTLHDLQCSDVEPAREIVLRTMADSLWLRDRLTGTSTLTIVGAGILGMEIASTAAHQGLHVTVIDVLPPLTAQCGPAISSLVARHAAEQGVTVVHAPEGAHLVDVAGAVAVQAGGRLFEADTVVSAVGCIANTDWLKTSGLELRGGGLAVDSRCRAGADIVAAGDVVAFGDAPRRTPHWSNALDQARTAANSLMLGNDAPPHVPRPFFWTEQFGLSIKMAGSGARTGQPTVIEGSLDEGSAILQWSSESVPNLAATVNRRLPMAKLQRLAGAATG